MPYRRRYRKKNYPLSRRQTKAIKKIALGTLETKTLNQDWNGVELIPGGVGLQFANIGGGDTQGQRDGNQVKLLSVQGKFVIKRDDADPQTSTAVRMILYIPKDADEVLGTTAQWRSGIDLDSFTVLMDRTYTVSSQNPITTGSFYKALRARVTWKTTTGTDWAKNPVHCLFCSDASATGPLIYGHFRTRYKDV